LKNTAEFILSKTAPIFNRNGYVGTSLSDLTKATGMTKGAIYGNFLNKEDLALKAFQWNLKEVVYPLFGLIAKEENNLKKLYLMTNYHRGYHQLTKKMGGCPILNVGLDSKFINPLLYKAARKISRQFEDGLIAILEDGKGKGEFSKKINPAETAKNMLSMIEGSTFMSLTHNDNDYIVHAMDFIDKVLIEGIRK